MILPNSDEGMNVRHTESRFGTSVWLVTLLVALSSLVLFVRMTSVSRLGNPWNHVLTSNFYGVPQELKIKGVEPFYTGAKEVGWDGQFYYFMSNDLLARSSESLKHFDDSISYRYQRIGLPLIAKLASVVLMQGWVSPSIYYLASFLLVCLSSFFLASYFRSQNVSPFAVLIWALALGTQLTMMTGLPDAAADSLLIMSFVMLIRQRFYLYLVLSTLAALTREAYIIFPFSVLLVAFLRQYGSRLRIFTFGNQVAVVSDFRLYLSSLMPIVVFLAWRFYISVHFLGMHDEGPRGIVGWPGIAFLKYLHSGLTGHHLYVQAGERSYVEAILLCFFAIFVFAGLICGVGVGLRSLHTNSEPALTALAFTAIFLSALYACFGSTVMMHYSGYLKAANVFLWIVPVLLVALLRRLPSFVWVGWCVYVAVTMPVLWQDWINNPSAALSRYTSAGSITTSVAQACRDDIKVAISFQHWETTPARRSIYNIWLPYSMIAWVSITNNGDLPLVSSHAAGSINVGSRWIVKNSSPMETTSEGPRTMFRTPLLPGETRQIAVVVKKPSKPGSYELTLGPVQEMCRWTDSDPKAGAWRQDFVIR